jgi:hypothetical protein
MPDSTASTADIKALCRAAMFSMGCLSNFAGKGAV